jgi:hypothetical protein
MELRVASRVEGSFMHASRDINVSREYIGAGKGCAGTIVKLVLGKMSLGADIASQCPDATTYVHPSSRRYVCVFILVHVYYGCCLIRTYEKKE